MTQYTWAVNKVKFERAYNYVLVSNKTPTEEEVKKRYVEYGGLLREEQAKQAESPRPQVTAKNIPKVSTKTK
jgi:hypothetical protein